MRVRDEQKEAAIRRMAMEMIVEQGFDGLSMSKLAKAVGVSPATIYIYFKDKEDMIVQLCQSESERMVAATLQGFDPMMNFEEGLRLQWKNRSAYLLNNRLETKFMEQAKHTPYAEQAVKYVRESFSARMGAFVKNAISNNQLRQLPVEVYWSVAFAPLYTLIDFHFAKRGFGPNKSFKLTDEIMEQALQLVLRALKP